MFLEKVSSGDHTIQLLSYRARSPGISSDPGGNICIFLSITTISRDESSTYMVNAMKSVPFYTVKENILTLRMVFCHFQQHKQKT